jgi:hypothetical protein
MPYARCEAHPNLLLSDLHWLGSTHIAFADCSVPSQDLYSFSSSLNCILLQTDLSIYVEENVFYAVCPLCPLKNKTKSVFNSAMKMKLLLLLLLANKIWTSVVVNVIFQ